jgi:hypothetical protein
MDPNLNLRIIHERAQAVNRDAERFGVLVADRRLGASLDTDVPVTVRRASVVGQLGRRVRPIRRLSPVAALSRLRGAESQ